MALMAGEDRCAVGHLLDQKHPLLVQNTAKAVREKASGRMSRVGGSIEGGWGWGVGGSEVSWSCTPERDSACDGERQERPYAM